jgi:hypothetical protein
LTITTQKTPTKSVENPGYLSRRIYPIAQCSAEASTAFGVDVDALLQKRREFVFDAI